MEDIVHHILPYCDICTRRNLEDVFYFKHKSFPLTTKFDFNFVKPIEKYSPIAGIYFEVERICPGNKHLVSMFVPSNRLFGVYHCSCDVLTVENVSILDEKNNTYTKQ